MFEYMLGGIFMAKSMTYGWENTYQEKIKKIDLKNAIVFLLFSIGLALNYKFSSDFFKFIISIMTLIFANIVYFKKNIKNTLISVISVEIVAIIAELLFGISVLAISKITNNEVIMDTYFGSLITNGTISVMIIGMTILNVPYKIYEKLIIKTEKINNMQLLPIICLLVISIDTLFFSIYYKMPLIILMIINTIIMVVYGYIVLKITNEKNENLKIFEKYKKTADSLNEYHDIVNKYRVNNHENRNQLQTIERMAKASGDKYIEKYVQTLLDKHDQTKTKIELEKIVIPDGWLKTTLYTKLETIIQNNIKYTLDIDRSVKTSDLIDIDEHTMLDICNILNIFLDNAIEAVNEYEKSKIEIRLYKENNMLVISVSNPCSKNLEINKISDKGYTSKGEGRGYGLAFVKETVKNNKKLNNEKRISGGVFIQILKIKINKV